ncbi:MAG: hypothetical protein AAF371_00630 [Pseudomonadota bacterium]
MGTPLLKSQHPPAERQQGCLDRARRCAAAARLDRRLDSEAARLDAIRCADCPLHDEALPLLLKLLPAALGRRVVFHRPGARETTFDEDWLLRLMDTIRRGDENSATFALASRVEPRLRPTVRRLAERCVQSLDGAELELF